MRESLPGKLLVALLQVSPEKIAAIERILYGEESQGGQAEGASQAASPKPSQPDEPNLSLAAKVFTLLTALDPGNRLRKAPPIKVFLLRFRQNLSRSEIARICHCDKSLVALRLKTLQEKLPWQPQQLRELSAQVEAMQDAVKDSRAKRIYRKGAICGEDDAPESD